MSNLILIASAKQQGLNGIARGPSINKNGLVAFAGTNANCQGLYVGNGKDLFRNINPAFSSDLNRVFGDYVQINESGKVAAGVQ